MLLKVKTRPAMSPETQQMRPSEDGWLQTWASTFSSVSGTPRLLVRYTLCSVVWSSVGRAGWTSAQFSSSSESITSSKSCDRQDPGRWVAVWKIQQNTQRVSDKSSPCAVILMLLNTYFVKRICRFLLLINMCLTYWMVWYLLLSTLLIVSQRCFCPLCSDSQWCCCPLCPDSQWCCCSLCPDSQSVVLLSTLFWQSAVLLSSVLTVSGVVWSLKILCGCELFSIYCTFTGVFKFA